MADIKDFHAAAGNLTAKQRETDFDDLNYARANVDNGRNGHQFLNKNKTNNEEKKRQDKDIQQLTALQAMLQNDAEYAKLYNDTLDLLSRAETATENVLEQLQQELQQAENELQDIRDRASHLPDGTLVFKGNNGEIWNEHGQHVSSEDAETIVWKDGSPDNVEFTNGQQKANDLKTRIHNIMHYQVDVLGKSREALEDENNPMQKDEIRKIQKHIETKNPEYGETKFQPVSLEDKAVQQSSNNMEKPTV